MPYSTVEDARDNALRDGDLLDLASYIVQQVAPADTDPPTADYIARATTAERIVFRYLDKTDGGALASRTLTGAGAETYVNDPAISRLVSNVMSPADDIPGTVRRGIIL